MSRDDADACIRVVGARTHNLDGIDVAIPLGKVTAITGVSGAGKTSLALDTLYAESHRRYVETLSLNDRRFLPQFDKPPVERVENLPPAIAVGGAGGVPRGRTSVAESAGIAHDFRVLFARQSRVFCPQCGVEVSAHTPEEVSARILRDAPGESVTFAFPLALIDARSWHESWPALREEGFVRVEIDGVIHRCDGDAPEFPDPTSRPRVLLDRIRVDESARDRMVEAIDSAFANGGGSVDIQRNEIWSTLYESRTCPSCAMEFPNPEPTLFAGKDEESWCPNCRGSGQESASGRASTAKGERPCSVCRGSGLRPEVLAFHFQSANLAEWFSLRVSKAIEALPEKFDDGDSVAEASLARVRTRLALLARVGLGYLSLDRPARTLSVGEQRRVALAHAGGAGLAQTLFVLDEPTAGVHPAERASLLGAIGELRSMENTVVIVDHDPASLAGADALIELGPGAGRAGGKVVSSGTPDPWIERTLERRCSDLSRRLKRTPRPKRGELRLTGISLHNLREIELRLPVGVMVGVCGVGGAGKRSLVLGALYPALAQRLGKEVTTTGTWSDLVGGESIGQVVHVAEAPSGRTSRGCAATYLKFFDAVRTLFAETAEAKIRGLTPGDFSFNRPGGRCESCEGMGWKRVDMQFLPDAHLTCPECQGRRFQPRLLEVKLRGLDMAEVLDLSASEAFGFFRGETAILHKLKVLRDVGLDYLPLGQSLATLSSGEWQRLHLATFLGVRSSKRSLYIFEEPSLGLAVDDVGRLIECFSALVDVGHSVLVIDHDLALLSACDHLIELGPGAAEEGGEIIASCSPAELRNRETPTGQALARALELRKK